MLEEGYIDRATMQKAVAEPVTVATEHQSRAANYVADWVMDLLPGYVSSVSTDIVVKTTIDMRMQSAAEEAVRGTLSENAAKFKVSQGALVTLDNDGAVKALVGGRDYAASQFDRAVYAKRQPGSAFKPFVYLAAVEHGYTPDSVIEDAPISIKGWQPKNYEGGYMGLVSLELALARSLNTVAARLAAAVGPPRSPAPRAGSASSPLHENPFDRARDRRGHADRDHVGLRALRQRRRLRRHSLRDRHHPHQGRHGAVPSPGRRRRPRDPARGRRHHEPHAGDGGGARHRHEGRDSRPARRRQTGTSQDFRDAWFIGYVKASPTGVWLGNDDNSPTRKATGGALTSGLWHDYMTRPSPASRCVRCRAPSSRRPRRRSTIIAATIDGLEAQGSALPTGSLRRCP